MDAIARSPKQIGLLIQRHRKARGWSQSQLAGEAGMRQEMVSKIETGQAGSRLSSIYALLAALNLEMTVRPRTASGVSDVLDVF